MGNLERPLTYFKGMSLFDAEYLRNCTRYEGREWNPNRKLRTCTQRGANSNDLD